MFQRSLLYAGAVFFLVIGVTMLTAPGNWFAGTPGVSATGAYNHHFIVDIGFAFMVSGGVLGAGVWLRQRGLVLAGLAWPLLHASFHLASLLERGAVSSAAWMTEITGVILPAALLLVLSLRAPLSGLGAGVAALVHAAVRKFEARYRYDGAYLHQLVDLAPDSTRLLAALQAVSTRPVHAPASLLHGAALAASMHEDCGPCVQITIDKILASGGDAESLRALIRHDFVRADPPAALGFCYVAAVLSGKDDALVMRDEILVLYGQHSLADLTLAAVIARSYPTMKKLMGYGARCQRLDVAGQSETVTVA